MLAMLCWKPKKTERSLNNWYRTLKWRQPRLGWKLAVPRTTQSNSAATSKLQLIINLGLLAPSVSLMMGRSGAREAIPSSTTLLAHTWTNTSCISSKENWINIVLYQIWLTRRTVPRPPWVTGMMDFCIQIWAPSEVTRWWMINSSR